MKKFLFAVFAAVLIAGCTVPAPTRPQPRFAYKQYPPVVLNIATIDIKQEYTSPMNKPNVEHLMVLPLPQAVYEWARDRFQAGGSDGTATIIIKDAHVVAQGLPRTDGVKGWFTVDQAERYDAKIAVEIQVNGTALGNEGSGSVSVTRGQTVGENASIQDRDRAWTDMTETMITDLDAGAQQMMRKRLPFLIK